MSSPPRLYLDHAATGWPKPPSVAAAMADYIDKVGAAAGRGVYASAAHADRLVGQIRRRLNELISGESNPCISLHPSGTAAVNAGLFGLLRDGDHVVTTAADHNAVLRPLEHLRQSGRITLDIVPTDTDGRVSVDDVLSRLQSQTRMVAMTGASNVTGVIQPVAEIAQALLDRPTIMFCDAAQNFAATPIDVRVGIDVLAAPGHKFAGGPLGTGFLYVAPELHDSIVPTMFGGTGSQSESLAMPTQMPDKLETGNLNVPAIAGWLTALPDAESVHQRQSVLAALATRLHQGILETGWQTTPRAGELPIVPFWDEGLAATEIAMILASEFGIEVRAGHHCSARIASQIGAPHSGVVRASAGPETTDSDVDRLLAALREIRSSLDSAR